MLDKTHMQPHPCQIIGSRDYQEDSFCVQQIVVDRQDAWLMAVADGMGGHAGGQQASELAIKAVKECFEPHCGTIQEAMRSALVRANQAIGAHVRKHTALTGMGCTLLITVCIDKHLYWLSVGDSILYLLRGTELKRLNADHSMTPVLLGLLKMGRISQEEFEHDPRRHQLCSYINGGEINMLDLSDNPQQLQKGDVILVASDGIDSLPISDLIHFVSAQRKNSNQAICEEIIKRVEFCRRPKQDNTTLIVFKLEH